MGIGGSIFLVAVGAILAFAVEYTVAGVDITVIGYILMAAGVAALVLSLYLMQRTSDPGTTGTGDRGYPDRRPPSR